MHQHKKLTWQLLAVAAMIKRIAPFLQSAASLSTDGKVPGNVHKNQGSHIAPKPDSENLRAKFLKAFNSAHPSLERVIVDQILDRPDRLGHNSFIEAIQGTSNIIRILVA